VCILCKVERERKLVGEDMDGGPGRPFGERALVLVFLLPSGCWGNRERVGRVLASAARFLWGLHKNWYLTAPASVSSPQP